MSTTAEDRVLLKVSTSDSISITFNSIFKFLANAIASSKDSLELYFDGIATPITLSDPKASTHIAAVKAESIPPEMPMSTFLKLFFVT